MHLSSVSRRPLSALYLAQFGEGAFQGHISASSIDCPNSLRFSRSLVRLIRNAKGLHTVAEFHVLVDSIKHLVSVYLARLVSKRDDSVLATPQLPLSAFYCLDDLFVLCMRADAFYQSSFHDALLKRYRRILHYASRHLLREFCSPPAVSGTPRSVTAPVGSRLAGGTRLSNLDINGILVKRGCLVSWGGLRFHVVRVYMGRFFASPVDSFGNVRRNLSQRLMCESVQVVG